jgi:hybrid cluster-associated redox disulfide protein
MACQRHNVELEPMVARLIASASGTQAPEPAGAGVPRGATARKVKLSRGEQPIRPDSVLGDILAAYPETEKVFRKYYGDGCFSCPGQATESVKQSAMMHNVSEKEILTDLNRAAGF